MSEETAKPEENVTMEISMGKKDAPIKVVKLPTMPKSINNIFGEKAKASRGGTRTMGMQHKSKTSLLKNELSNINEGVTPFFEDSSGIDVRDTIELCQKAYWNISIFRLTIDIMTEFSNSDIHWRGGTKKSRAFFQEWYKKINGWALTDKFFREWFRSGNIFLYRIESQVDLADMVRRAYGSASDATIPIRYILLNPVDIKCRHSASFSDSEYCKVLNAYEISILKNPKTEQEKQFKMSLPPEVREKIDKNQSVEMTLDSKYLHSIFCKKQDYEPLSIPMYFPVLFDINLKLTFKKAEQTIARTTDYIILLITMGAEEAKGGVNQDSLDAMTELFATESVGRVLVADWTTKMEFVVPDLNKILGPEKYDVVNDDIANGLVNIFFSQQKFAESMVKIKVFLERLKEARKAYLNGFLLPEVERISKMFGFKDYPIPEFEDVNLEDEKELQKLYNRLAELGFLTPEELFETYETHKLPTKENSIESQEEFKALKKKGLYEPLIGGKKEDAAPPAGRPSGTKAPQTTKKVKPAGASRQFSVSKLKDTIDKANKLEELVAEKFKEKFGIKRLSQAKKDSVTGVTKMIIQGEEKDSWEQSVDKYLSGDLQEKNEEFIDTITEISDEHCVSVFLASLLAHSQID